MPAFGIGFNEAPPSGEPDNGPDWGPDPDAKEVLTFKIKSVKCHVDLQDLDSFLVEQVTPEGPAASLRLKCLWTKRWDLVRALMGHSYLKDGSLIVREDPYEYPPVEGIFCTSVPDIRGIKPYRDDTGDFAGQAGMMAFRYAVVTANFTKPPYQIAIDDTPEDNDLSDLAYVTTSLKVSTETLSPPGGAYYFRGGVQNGQPIQDTTAGFVFTRFEITMRRWFMPVVPLFDISGLLGCTNKDVFEVGMSEFPAGQVLFMGVDLEPAADPADGTIRWNIDYKFLANADSQWNAVLDREGKWRLVTTSPTGDGGVPFPEADLLALMKDIIATDPYFPSEAPV